MRTLSQRMKSGFSLGRNGNFSFHDGGVFRKCFGFLGEEENAALLKFWDRY